MRELDLVSRDRVCDGLADVGAQVRRADAKQRRASFRLELVQREGHNPHVVFNHDIRRDNRPFWCCAQHGGHRIRPLPHGLDVDHHDLAGGDPAVSLLLHPLRQVRMAEPERRVICKGGLCHRCRLIIDDPVVHAVHGDAAGVRKCRHENDKARRPVAAVDDSLRENVGLDRVMSAQRRVAATHEPHRSLLIGRSL